MSQPSRTNVTQTFKNNLIQTTFDPTKQHIPPYQTIFQPTPTQTKPTPNKPIPIPSVNPPPKANPLDKISDKIYNHFKTKYPSTIDASGFSKTTIQTIVQQAIKRGPLNESSIGKIIDIIDHKFKTTMHSENRRGNQYDTASNFTMDEESKISIDK